MEIYRGDTLAFDFSAVQEDGTAYTFQNGDIIKVGIKDKITKPKCVLLRIYNITEAMETIAVVFSATEMKTVSSGEKILEVELTTTDGTVKTLYQNKLIVKGDVINE